jgi:hypothetical protein
MKKMLSLLTVVSMMVFLIIGSVSLANHSESLPNSASDEVLVVSVNINEVSSSDVADTSDMDRFAKQLLKIMPNVPDVILLQNVVGKGVANIKNELNEHMPVGNIFKIAMRPYWDTTDGDDPNTKRNTGIIYNESTMAKDTDSGGWIQSEYTEEESDGSTITIKEHARVSFTKADSGIKVAVASVHLVPNFKLADLSTAVSKKNQWIGEIIDEMDVNYPPSAAQINIIAGEINLNRCAGNEEFSTISCTSYSFWDTLTGTGGYSDNIYDIHGSSTAAMRSQYAMGHQYDNARNDFIFTTGADILDTTFDVSYNLADQPSSKNYYGDKRLLWSLLKVN